MMDNFFRDVVESLAKQSKCVSQKVAAIIVKDERIISTGYNGTIGGYYNCNDIFDPNSFDADVHHEWSKKMEIHAEQNALMMACKNGIPVEGCKCYTNLQPCELCLLLLIQAGIKEIVYLKDYPRSTWSDELLDLVEKKGIVIRKMEGPE